MLAIPDLEQEVVFLVGNELLYNVNRIKGMMKRTQDSEDFYLALLHLRNTDREVLPSPKYKNPYLIKPITTI